MRSANWSRNVSAYDILHVGITATMRAAARGCSTLSVREIVSECRRLHRLMTSLRRYGVTNENLGEVYVILGLVPVHSPSRSAALALRNRLHVGYRFSDF